MGAHSGFVNSRTNDNRINMNSWCRYSTIHLLYRTKLTPTITFRNTMLTSHETSLHLDSCFDHQWVPSARFRQPYQWMNTGGVWVQYLYSQVISLNHLSNGFAVSCVYPRYITKDGEVLDDWWGSYPLGRYARATIPVDLTGLNKQHFKEVSVGGTFWLLVPCLWKLHTRPALTRTAVLTIINVIIWNYGGRFW